MSGQFPMFKLATLLARQMSSPIAARIKRIALAHPRVGEVTCGVCARVYSAAEWRARALVLRLAGTALPPAPPPLSAARARDLGSNLLGEVIIFVLGSLIVIFEVNRQAVNKQAKSLYRKSEWLAVRLTLEELQRELQLQQEDIDRLRHALDGMQVLEN